MKTSRKIPVFAIAIELELDEKEDVVARYPFPPVFRVVAAREVAMKFEFQHAQLWRKQQKRLVYSQIIRPGLRKSLAEDLWK